MNQQALSDTNDQTDPFTNKPDYGLFNVISRSLSTCRAAINIKDGNIALTNNDHTLLGLRASTYLMPYLPEKYKLLPLLQSVWYIGAGLDIWNELLQKYPGRYATMKGVTVPPPSDGPTVWLEDAAPIVEAGMLEERVHSYMVATMTGELEARAWAVPRHRARPRSPPRAAGDHQQYVR